jgi:FKBP-type peptidyl-prolyl cis-trans isomerase
MQKPSISIANLLTVGVLLAGTVLAQQTPAAPMPSAPSQSGAAAAAAPSDNSPFKTDKEKASYALGMNIGSTFVRQSVDVDPNVLVQGLKDEMAGGKTLMSEDEARATLTKLQAEMRQKQMEKMQAEGEANKKEGAEFLAANKAKAGVITLPSGLQYKVVSNGTGPKPVATDTVVCNYRGTLINGKEFDSSYKRGEPATFPVSGVIKGWTEALQLMPVGSKWQLFVPADLAYGERGPSPDIGPNATLIFDVELISIKKDDKGAGAEKKNP